MTTLVYVQSCYNMREVYDRMCELRKMPALLKCSAGCETPEWVCVLRDASEHFKIMEKHLPYAETCDFAITVATPSPILKAIELFSASILRCQAYFPGQTLLCKHAIKAWEHLNIICMHCRTYQMLIMQANILENTMGKIYEQNKVYAHTNHVPVAVSGPPIPTIHPIPTPAAAQQDEVYAYRTKSEVGDLLRKLQNVAR